MADDSVETATKYCSTCKQDVPSANYEMHSIHCQRFLTPCPHCGESVNKQQLQEHIDEDHAQVKCDICKDNVEKIELETHKMSTCRLRNVNCPYCEITLPACDIDEHKESCGSRTEECENCRKRILIKDFEKHLASECETPSAKITECKNKVPERLIYGCQEGSGSDLGAAGFPLHAQFQPSYSSDVPFNPYFPLQEGDPYKYFENSSPEISSSVPKRNTQSKSTASMVNNRLQLSHRNKHGSPSSANVRSKSMVENIRSGISHQPTFGSDGSLTSDSDADNFEEKKPFPDLNDDTFLPCEFCDELLPADSLGFHQATCENVPPTPRSGSPSKFKRLSPDSLPSRVESFKPYQDEAAAIPSSSVPFRSNTPDIGEGSAPCEFCFLSYPLKNLALHQITCSQNPNLQKPDTSDDTFPTPRRQKADMYTRKENSEQPKSHSSPVEAPRSDSPRLSPNTEAKATKPTPNVKAREKRCLAPNFSNETQESTVKHSASLPRNKNTLNNPGTVDRKPHVQRKNKRKSKPIPRPANPRVFHEVNALGSNRHQEFGSISMHGNPLVSRFPNSNEPLLNPGRFPGPRRNFTRGQKHMRGQYFRREDATREQNFTRGYSARGRSYGSRTVTIQPRNYNPRARQASRIHGEEQDVKSEPDLTLHGQTTGQAHGQITENRPHGVTRLSFRGPGRRLGSGDSSAIWNRPFCPPRKNTLD